MNAISKGIKGTQLSSRIYTLVVVIVGLVFVLIMWGLGTGTNSAKQKQKTVVVSNQNKDNFNALKGIKDAVPSATGKPNKIIVEKNGKDRVIREKQDNSELERLRMEMAKMKLQALNQAMGSPLSVGGSGSQAAQYDSKSTALGGAGPGGQIIKQAKSNTAYQAANEQQAKMDFALNAGKNETKQYLDQTTTDQKFKLEVKAGSIIPAVLQTGINSDLPGSIIAQVRRNVYDSKTGKDVLIPQGSKLIGLYSSQVAYGQSRVLMAWNRIIFPDGQNLNLEGMEGADLAGYAGIEDKVNTHIWKVFSSAILMSLFTAGVQYSQQGWNNNNSSGNGFNAGSIISGALGLQLGQAGIAMVQKNLNIQPTLEIRPGNEFNVLVTRDIPFRKPYHIQAY